MIELNERDLAAVAKIQEIKNTTPARAREIYRKAATKLANQDVENRDEIILENMQRVNGSAAEEVKVMASSEEKPKKAKKAKKAKAVKAAKPKKERVAREPFEPPKLAREVDLKPAGEEDPHVFTANLFGRKHAVAYMEASRPEPASTAPFHFSEKKIAEVKKFAKANDMPIAFCAAISVKEKQEQGYAVPEEAFKKFSTKMSRERVRMSLSGEARKHYQESGAWTDCKFSVEEKAA